jgi:hypothetical protein
MPWLAGVQALQGFARRRGPLQEALHSGFFSQSSTVRHVRTHICARAALRGTDPIALCPQAVRVLGGIRTLVLMLFFLDSNRHRSFHQQCLPVCRQCVRLPVMRYSAIARSRDECSRVDCQPRSRPNQQAHSVVYTHHRPDELKFYCFYHGTVRLQSKTSRPYVCASFPRTLCCSLTSAAAKQIACAPQRLTASSPSTSVCLLHG